MAERDNAHATYCIRHPHVETNLGCSRCGDPICPQCLIQTPVGARCPSCANVQRSPLVTTSGSEITKAALAGIGSGLALGIVSAFVLPILGSLGLFIVIIAFGGLGYVIGGIVHRASGYKRNTQLQVVAAVSVIVAFVAMSVTLGLGAGGIFRVGPVLLGVAVGVYFAIQRVKG